LVAQFWCPNNALRGSQNRWDRSNSQASDATISVQQPLPTIRALFHATHGWWLSDISLTHLRLITFTGEDDDNWRQRQSKLRVAKAKCSQMGGW